MLCKRCKRQNPDNLYRCMYCNTPFYGEYSNINMPGNKKTYFSGKKINNNKKRKLSFNGDRTDRNILTTIVALVLVLAVLLGGYSFQNLTPRNKGFRSGSGGGFITGPGSEFFELDVSRHAVALNSYDNGIYFYANLKREAESVKLTDYAGNEVAEMNDSGANGDKYAGDGVYTAKISVDTAQEANYKYRAVAGNIKSDAEIISVIAPLTNSELNDIATVDNELKTLRNSSDFENETLESKQGAILELLKDLMSRGFIEPDSIVVDEEISFYYSSGVIGNVRLNEYSNVVGGNGISDNTFYGDRALLATGGENTRRIASDVDAIVLYAWGNQYTEEWKGVYNDTVTVRDACRNARFNTTFDTNVTVGDLKNLSKYEFIYLGAHGIYSTFKYKSDEKVWFFSKRTERIKTSAFALTEPATKESDRNYSLDLKTGRIIKCNGEYLITSGFFDEYYGRDSFKDTIMFAGSCQLMGKNGNYCEDWAKVFDSKSMKAFVAFHNSVYIGYGNDLAKSIVDRLSAGRTIKQALNYAKEVNGENDAQWYEKVGFEGRAKTPAAFPVLRGDDNAVLVSNDGSLSGKVADSDTKNPISGVNVTARNRTDSDAVTASTDGQGVFVAYLPEGTYDVAVQATGYMTCNINNIAVTGGETTYLENTILLTQQNGNPLSKAGGIVSNAVSGEAVSGAKIRFRNNWNNKSGEYVTDTDGNVLALETDSGGKYYTDRLPYGYYTAEVAKEGYALQNINIIASNTASSALEQNVVLVPIASGNDFRITLEWDANPRDEDAHLVGDKPENFHVYYVNKTAVVNGDTVATLDHDDTEGNGFETITLRIDREGTYKYYVHHYAGSGSLSTSNAIVKVYQGNVMIKQFNVPADQGNGKYWNVFNIVNGEVIALNRISDSSSQ